MAQLGAVELKAHITWDTEPTEEAKAFIRAEVIAALRELFEQQSWFDELIQARIQAHLNTSRRKEG